MKMPVRPGTIIAILIALAAIASLWFAARPAQAETCFDRLGGPGPNSNTPRLDTLIDVPADQWPAAAQILAEFGTDNGWQVEQGSGDTDAEFRWLDMCNETGTIVRASNMELGNEGQIGFGIIHMTYDGPDRDRWQIFYRDLHRRIESRWPGRLRYIEGEFGEAIERPEWLDEGEKD